MDAAKGILAGLGLLWGGVRLVKHGLSQAEDDENQENIEDSENTESEEKTKEEE